MSNVNLEMFLAFPFYSWKDFKGLWLKFVNMGMVLRTTEVFSRLVVLH